MTPCERFKEKIFSLIDGELEGAAKNEVRRHLEKCPECARLYHGLYSLKHRLHEMKTVNAPDSFQVILRERIRRELANKQGFGMHPPASSSGWITGIAVASVILGAAFLVFQPFSRSRLPETLTEVSESFSDVSNMSRVRFVIDEVDSNPTVEERFGLSGMDTVDSLFVEESFSSVNDLYQPVRF